MANTPYVIEDGDFQTTTLNGAITNVADTATIGTGLTIPATNGVLQIDYDSTEALGDANGPETVSYATYNSGTGALAGIARGLAGTTGVSHANGRSVQYGPSSVVLQGLQDGTSLDINIGARVYLSENQTLTTGTATKITLNTETYDLGNNFAANKFIVPVGGAGTYLITGAIQYSLQTDGKYCLTEIWVNGAQISIAIGQTGSTTSVTPVIVDILRLNVGDYVELYGFHNKGSNGSVVGGSAATFMAVQFLST